MNPSDSIVLNIQINCTYIKAYTFLVQPENFVQWAAGLGSALKKSGNGWNVETPAGIFPIRFTPANDFGVLDHWVTLPAGDVYVPMRIVKNSDGCDVSITLFRQPDMDDAMFARDKNLIQADLQSLKSILER